jgi:hypothetical protein
VADTAADECAVQSIAVDEDMTNKPDAAPAAAPARGLRAWCAHAFAIEPYDETSLSPEEKAVLERLAKQIDDRHLTTAAVLLVQSNRNMNWIGSQILVMFQPIFDLTHPLLNALLRNFGLNVPQKDYPVLCTAFEKRYSIEYFSQRLEAYAAGEYNNNPVQASDKPA